MQVLWVASAVRHRASACQFCLNLAQVSRKGASLQKTFRTLDANKDGVLSVDELQKGLADIGIDISEEDFRWPSVCSCPQVFGTRRPLQARRAPHGQGLLWRDKLRACVCGTRLFRFEPRYRKSFEPRFCDLTEILLETLSISCGSASRCRNTACSRRVRIRVREQSRA